MISNRSSIFPEDELRYLKSKHIEIKNLKSRWDWINTSPNILQDFYEKVICVKFKESPKSKDLDTNGYRGFRAAVKRLGLTINDLKIELGYNPHFKYKYKGMNYEQLINYFHDTIIPYFKKKYPEVKNSYLRYNLVSKEFRGFVDKIFKLSHLDKKEKNFWATFIQKSGFQPLKTFQYKGKNMADLVDCFSKTIYPKLKELYGLNDKQAPLKEQLVKKNHGFYRALNRLGYNLTDLYVILGFEHKYRQIYANKSYDQLIMFFKDIIQPSLQAIYDFSNIQAPAYEEVESNYRGFIQALSRHGKKLSDIIRDSGFLPRNFSNLGVITHSTMNQLLSISINNRNVPYKYYSEVELFSSSNYRIDGFIFIDKALINNFYKKINEILYSNSFEREEKKSISNLLRRIDGKLHLLIDFSNGFFKRGVKANSEIIASKIYKYLDYPNSFLLLIGTNWSYKQLIKRLPKTLKYKNQNFNTKNLALISPKLFALLMGFEAKNKKIIEEIISSNINEDLDKIQKILKSLNEIKDKKIYSTSDFNLKKKKNLITRWL